MDAQISIAMLQLMLMILVYDAVSEKIDSGSSSLNPTNLMNLVRLLLLALLVDVCFHAKCLRRLGSVCGTRSLLPSTLRCSAPPDLPARSGLQRIDLCGYC